MVAQNDQLNAILQSIDDSIARESWREAHQGLRELARLLVDATIASDNEQVALIDEQVAQVFLDISLDDEFQSELTLNSVGWSADGIREVSQLARKRRPPMTSTQRAAVLQDAETRILALLADGNGGPWSNRDIADRLKLNVATVARTLSALRATKKVRSWPEGRFMMNELASAAAQTLSIAALNARSLNLDAVSGSAGKKASVPRNTTPPSARHSPVQSSTIQKQAETTARKSIPSNTEPSIAFIEAIFEKIKPQMDLNEITPSSQESTTSEQNLGDLRNDRKTSEDTFTNRAPDQHWHSFRRSFQDV